MQKERAASPPLPKSPARFRMSEQMANTIRVESRLRSMDHHKFLTYAISCVKELEERKRKSPGLDQEEDLTTKAADHFKLRLTELGGSLNEKPETLKAIRDGIAYAGGGPEGLAKYIRWVDAFTAELVPLEELTPQELMFRVNDYE